jgi:DNA-directed RNA polymerase specialized sigma24 family protein
MKYEEASRNTLINNIVLKSLSRLSYYYTDEELESERDFILFNAVITWKPERSNFYTWVTNCSNYYVLDKFKKLGKNKEYELTVDPPGPNIETTLFVNSALESLETTKRTIIEYKYLHGYTNKEICEMLDISRTNYFPLLKEAKEEFMEIFNAERNISKG